MVYRCLIAIVLCCLHCTQWLHRCCVQFVSRHRYTITVNIGFTRHNDLRTRAADDRTEKIQFNKPTQVVALIVNERIPDVDLCQVIVNSIVFFRRLNIEHLIIYDYQGRRWALVARCVSMLDRSRVHQSLPELDHGLRSSVRQDR